MVAAVTPKDKGWSWLILAASFTVTAIMSSSYTSGIFYVVFLDVFQGNRPTTAWIVSLQPSLLCLCCPLMSVIHTKVGSRLMVIFGSLLAFLGFFLGFFSQNLIHILLAYGILAGFGMSVIFLPTNVIVGFYFEKYRSVAYGICTMASGLSTLFYGPFTQICIGYFGWRGTMWIFAGIYLNICICGAVMRPPVTKTPDTVSQTGWKAQLESNEKKKCFNLSLLTNSSLMCFSVSTSLCTSGLAIAYTHLPALAMSHGSSSTQAATLLSVYGAANCIGRPSAGFLITLTRVDTLVIHATSCVLAAASSILLTLVGETFPGQAISTFLISLFGNVHVGILSPAIIDIVGLEGLADGLSIAVFAMGIGGLAGPPIAGWLVDLTGAYHVSFYFCAGCFLMAALVMAPVVYTKWRRRNSSSSTIKSTVILHGSTLEFDEQTI